MSEPVPCPSCGALLQLPPGATTVRCPDCQAVLEVEPEESAPPPVAAPAPPPRPAIPLPFGRPAPAAPVAARPAPPKAALPAVAPVRAKLAADDPYTPDGPRDETSADADRRRSVRAQLAELEEKEARQRERYDELAGRCRLGRLGVSLLAAGCVCSALAAVAYFVFVITTLTATPFSPVLWAAGGFLVLNWGLTVAGFGTCCCGPPQGQGLAIAGVGVTALHLGLTVITAVVLLALVSLENIGYGGEVKSYVLENLLLSNTFNNTSVLVDVPLILLAGMLDRPFVLVVPFLGGAFEFAKLSLLGVLGNRYAAEAKAPDLAHQSMRFVFRVFTAILLAAVLKVVIYAGVRFSGGDPLIQNLFAIPVLMATNGYYMWWAFAHMAQYQTLSDVATVTTADRFVDTRDRLDVV